MTSHTGDAWTWNAGAHTFRKTNASATVDENVIIELSGGNTISLAIPSGLQPPAPTPTISASINGKLSVGAGCTIQVNLINSASWNNVTTPSGWTRNADQTFTKYNASAQADEIVTLKLSGTDVVTLIAPSGYDKPAQVPTIYATVSGTIASDAGATITIGLTNGAQWSNVSVDGPTSGTWTANPTAHTYYKKDFNVFSPETLTFSLSGGNTVTIAVPTGENNCLELLNGTQISIRADMAFLTDRVTIGDFVFYDLNNIQRTVDRAQIKKMRLRNFVKDQRLCPNNYNRLNV
jgi:hypothetical protein